MFSDGDSGQLSPVGESSVPVPNRMLRRLKKATSISDICPESENPGGEDSQMVDLEPGREDELRSDFEGLGVGDNGVGAKKALDFESIDEELGEEGEDGGHYLKTGEETRDFDSMAEELGEEGEDGARDLKTGEETRDFDSMAEELGEEGGDGSRDLKIGEEIRDFDSMAEELGEEGDDGAGYLKTGEEIRNLEMIEASKTRSILDGNDGDEHEDVDGDLGIGEEIRDWELKETSKKRPIPENDGDEDGLHMDKKKKKKKSIGFDELPVSSASMNMSKKERREYLDQLRAENQRLLRETRDATFQPVPLVRKPISSVLEKIRQRKQEISRKFLRRNESCSIETCDGLERDVMVDAEYEEVIAEEMGDGKSLKMKSKRTPERKKPLEKSNAGSLGNSDYPSHDEAESNPTPEDPSGRYQMTDMRDELPENTPSSPLEEVMAPSELAMNLRLNSSPVHDDSCEEEEEENDKENLDPEACSSSPKGDPVRAFIDEEAEEEDDSDNDLLRFKDDEEDEDEGDDDLRDMIVSQFREDAIDKERRNELHQKWLEQQDAAGTEKLLQKLKRGVPQDETLLLEEEDDADADDEEEGAESDDVNGEEDSCQAYSTRMIIKKIKEMIPLEFTDKSDDYVVSDDDEMEEMERKHRFSNKMELKAKIPSPATDEGSKELFYRIKKVNNIPENRKKVKPSSFSDKLLMGINRNAAPSKSSFLSRGLKSSLPTAGSHKRGSGIVRGFIFERDDGNSRSSSSAPEKSSETIQEKSQPTRVQAKFNCSQSQIRSKTSQTRGTEDETSSRTPLYEILKRSSMKSCFTSRQSVSSSSSHAESMSIFAAFKVDKKQS
ncbi:PREDICTED: spore wall protein 2 [Tarenaya hassleriana]|uniref:spore wall protein 2 n=1 Tax=Tarenaya hassleriana TaxID=28532 RepID=UPI00053C0F98|nr:PREDICTED: spore wall protein 2 [Tarenaya hassleriana]XP_010539918.1 PREDICTED: spore wall protein 2 [Tarenaya hassleriana]XP_010539919.1 PREDICTED: spore wall protein 2 [Tarenaya hassleriana]